MSLERLLKEQVYHYKRKRYLKNGRRGISDKSLGKYHASYVGSFKGGRKSRKVSFYSASIRPSDNKRALGILCIILGCILFLTTCFSRGTKQVTLAPELENNKVLEVEVQESIADVTQNKNEEVFIEKKEEVLVIDSEESSFEQLERYYESLRDFDIEKKELKNLFDLSLKYQREFAATLAIWSVERFNGATNSEAYRHIKRYGQDNLPSNYALYEKGINIYKQFIYDVKYFPIVKHKDYTFKNNWEEKNLFDQDTLHYGIDIIDPKSSAGKIPIVSMSDGTVENIGWTDTGGYRVGIRSSGGAYFYYAHLHELPMHIQKGDQIKAGDYIGLMGNTGCGVEGARGKVPVQLHVGIAVKDEEGKEFWINPYPALTYIEDNRISAVAVQ